MVLKNSTQDGMFLKESETFSIAFSLHHTMRKFIISQKSLRLFNFDLACSHEVEQQSSHIEVRSQEHSR